MPTPGPKDRLLAIRKIAAFHGGMSFITEKTTVYLDSFISHIFFEHPNTSESTIKMVGMEFHEPNTKNYI